MNREPMTKLADYLAALPEGYDHFDMDSFMWRNDRQLSPAANVSVCGTVACVVGHGPASGFAPKRGEVWYDYSERLSGMPRGASEWDWCFSFCWSEADNTPQGAVARIHWLLDGNPVPKNWMEQATGFAPLAYTT